MSVYGQKILDDHVEVVQVLQELLPEIIRSESIMTFLTNRERPIVDDLGVGDRAWGSVHHRPGARGAGPVSAPVCHYTNQEHFI